MYLVSRTESFAKFFFFLSFSGLLMYIVLAFYSFHTTYIMSKSEKDTDTLTKLKPFAIKNLDPGKQLDPNTKLYKNIKYILMWTSEVKYALKNDGHELFIKNNCSDKNCYLTTNKNLLNRDVTNFNAIVFSIDTLKNWKTSMPLRRTPEQKYVFYSIKPADKFPVCNKMADNFFNWTWSYKLYSDIVTPFIEVRNLNNTVTAPKYGINWTEPLEITESSEESTDQTDLNNTIKVGNKSKALMWFPDRCDIDNATLASVQQLKHDLEKHLLTFDIYGCDYKKCPEEGCLKALERDHYFYLAQEHGFSEDYVTKEVLKAYHHNAVPVVVGGADYTKHLPYKSYIDATYESTEGLTSLINYAIRTPALYNSFFDWKNHSTIHEANLQKGYCDLCAMLNDQKVMKSPTVYLHFRKWWFYGSLKERCSPTGPDPYDDESPPENNVRKEKP